MWNISILTRSYTKIKGYYKSHVVHEKKYKTFGFFIQKKYTNNNARVTTFKLLGRVRVLKRNNVIIKQGHLAYTILVKKYFKLNTRPKGKTCQHSASNRVFQ